MKDINRKYYLLAWESFWANQKKQDEDLKKCAEAMQKEIEKQEKASQKIIMMREHPEWFETITPKQYGINLLKTNKYGRSPRIRK